HKAGYCNYPAGAMCYRNGAFRDVVTFTAPEVHHGDVDPTVGVYGVEGSKPGATTAAVWLSHRVLRTDQSGYGYLLGRANFNHKRWYCAVITMAQPEDPFVVIPFQRLPAERAGKSPAEVQAQLEWIRKEIVPKSDEELVASPEKMAFLREIGSDLAISTYVINFRTADGLNRSVSKLNSLTQAIFDKLSQQIWDGGKIPTEPLFVTSSDFDSSTYGQRFMDAYRKRIGVEGDETAPISFL